MDSGFESRLVGDRQDIELTLDRLIPAVGSNPLAEPMRHAVMGGGKRLRGYLVLETARLFNVNRNQALHAAAAIEAMHGYSLVHDDLPCMDDDDLRRGKPTVHIKWDEATAVLVGDALQTLAFEALALPACSPKADVRAHMLLSLAQAAGARGMVLGQAQDIAAETGAPLDLEGISELQRNKTGRLIEWSATAGARLAQQNEDALAKYARALGLAFQIQDDVLDVTGDAGTTGKAVRKDADAGKATFVSLLGLANAKKRAAELVEEARDAISPYGAAADALRQAADFVVNRSM